MIRGTAPGALMLTMHGDVMRALSAAMPMANLAHLPIGRIGVEIGGCVARPTKGMILPPVLAMRVPGLFPPAPSLFNVGVMPSLAVIGRGCAAMAVPWSVS